MIRFIAGRSGQSEVAESKAGDGLSAVGGRPVAELYVAVEELHLPGRPDFVQLKNTKPISVCRLPVWLAGGCP